MGDFLLLNTYVNFEYHSKLHMLLSNYLEKTNQKKGHSTSMTGFFLLFKKSYLLLTFFSVILRILAASDERA